MSVLTLALYVYIYIYLVLLFLFIIAYNYRYCFITFCLLFLYSHVVLLCLCLLLPTGNDLIPDYFLDEAEQVRDEWAGDSPSSSDSGSGSSLGQIFDKIRPLINQDTISNISATYKFVVTEETPGECVRVCECEGVWSVCGSVECEGCVECMWVCGV